MIIFPLCHCTQDFFQHRSPAFARLFEAHSDLAGPGLMPSRYKRDEFLLVELHPGKQLDNNFAVQLEMDSMPVSLASDFDFQDIEQVFDFFRRHTEPVVKFLCQIGDLF